MASVRVISNDPGQFLHISILLFSIAISYNKDHLQVKIERVASHRRIRYQENTLHCEATFSGKESLYSPQDSGGTLTHRNTVPREHTSL